MLQFHVAISLVGILSGFVMLYGLLLGQNFRTAIAVLKFRPSKRPYNITSPERIPTRLSATWN